ncbi:hypothetical protein C0995_002293 [Termitomyces sp. Mi166|nr:hypothetical protein C0995_002293 [Termitomyces sp. Mi166\
MFSGADDASASFTFNGTGVEIFGARRGNHGLYAIRVDNTSYPTQNGSANPDIFQQSLFTVQGLQQGQHEVTITNVGTTFVDIDYISWVTNLDGPSNELFIKTFQDTDPSFMFSGSAWQSDPNAGRFIDRSARYVLHTLLKMAFQDIDGEGVSLYGPVSTSGAEYTVQLDGGILQVFSSNKQLLSTGAIVGITVAAVSVVGALVALFLFFQRRRAQYAAPSSSPTQDIQSRSNATLNTHLMPTPFRGTSPLSAATVKGHQSDQSGSGTWNGHSSDPSSATHYLTPTPFFETSPAAAMAATTWDFDYTFE